MVPFLWNTVYISYSWITVNYWTVTYSRSDRKSLLILCSINDLTTSTRNRVYGLSRYVGKSTISKHCIICRLTSDHLCACSTGVYWIIRTSSVPITSLQARIQGGRTRRAPLLFSEGRRFFKKVSRSCNFIHKRLCKISVSGSLIASSTQFL